MVVRVNPWTAEIAARTGRMMMNRREDDIIVVFVVVVWIAVGYLGIVS